MSTKNKNATLVATSRPVEIIESLAYPGQDAIRKMHHGGYDKYFNSMYKLVKGDPMLKSKIQVNMDLMTMLSRDLMGQDWVMKEMFPPKNELMRIILSLDAVNEGEDNSELVVTKWGKGFYGGAHGHNTGLIWEKMLMGKMRVSKYRMVDPRDNIVRIIKTEIIKGEKQMSSFYEAPNENNYFKRQSNIHSITTLEDSVLLDFINDHARDLRDNQFEVENFETEYGLTTDHVYRVELQKAIVAMRPGDVAICRSAATADWGDHFVIRVDDTVVYEPQGVRPNVIRVEALPNGILDQYPVDNEIDRRTILMLKPEVQEAFMNFHGMRFENNRVYHYGQPIV